MMGQPIQKRPCQALCAEGFRPFLERQVAGDEGRSSFIAQGDEFEQKLCARFGQGHKAKFINDE